MERKTMKIPILKIKYNDSFLSFYYASRNHFDKFKQLMKTKQKPFHPHCFLQFLLHKNIEAVHWFLENNLNQEHMDFDYILSCLKYEHYDLATIFKKRGHSFKMKPNVLQLFLENPEYLKWLEKNDFEWNESLDPNKRRTILTIVFQQLRVNQRKAKDYKNEHFIDLYDNYYEDLYLYQ